MPALDDYGAPVPLWMLVCRVLASHPDGLSVTRVFVEVSRLTDGRAARPASVSAVLARMRADGICVAHVSSRGRQASHIHQLTDVGRAHYLSGLSVVIGSLNLNRRHSNGDTQKRSKKSR